MGRRNNEKTAAFFFLAPSIFGIMTFFLLPFIFMIQASFTNSASTHFVFMDNYIKVVNNSAFKVAFANTCRFICVCVPSLLLFSLILATYIHKSKKHKRFLKSSFLLPFAIPVSGIVLMWSVLFAKQGIINNILVTFHANPIDFMGTNAAFWILILTYIWKNAGYNIILWLTGFNSISSDLYEAAAVDGASSAKAFVYITLPNLKSSLFLIMILSLINSFKVFREAYLIAGNYPHESIYLLQHLFNNWFLSLDLARLSAGAVILALCLIAVVICAQRVFRGDSNETHNKSNV